MSEIINNESSDIVNSESSDIVNKESSAIVKSGDSPIKPIEEKLDSIDQLLDLATDVVVAEHYEVLERIDAANTELGEAVGELLSEQREIDAQRFEEVLNQAFALSPEQRQQLAIYQNTDWKQEFTDVYSGKKVADGKYKQGLTEQQVYQKNYHTGEAINGALHIHEAQFTEVQNNISRAEITREEAEKYINSVRKLSKPYSGVDPNTVSILQAIGVTSIFLLILGILCLVGENLTAKPSNNPAIGVSSHVR